MNIDRTILETLWSPAVFQFICTQKVLVWNKDRSANSFYDVILLGISRVHDAINAGSLDDVRKWVNNLEGRWRFHNLNSTK